MNEKERAFKIERLASLADLIKSQNEVMLHYECDFVNLAHELKNDELSTQGKSPHLPFFDSLDNYKKWKKENAKK